MSSDAIATSQRTAVSPTTKSIFSPSSDKDPDERSDAKIDSNNRYDVSSGDDDWNDGFCKLVIDLPETETDGEKVNIDAPRQQVKNNNNNNSLGGSPCPGKVSNSDKLNPSQGKCNPKNSLVSSSTNAGKNVKSKPKKSAKSSNKHHGSSANSRTSSPTAQNNETTNQNQSKNSHVFGAQDSRSSGLTSNSLRASNSPDEVGGKKKSSKSGRSHHKKHKHSLEKNESKSEGEKIKAKSKHSSCTNSPTSASSHYTSNNVTGTNASLTLPIKPPSFHRSASPSLTAITTTSSAPKFPHSPQTQARIPGRAPIAPGSCGSVQAPYDKDTENSHIQNNRKKYRKGQTNSNIVSSVNNNHSCGAVSTQPRADANVTDAQFRSFGNSGKRDRNSLPSEGSGSKKIKLEMDSKSSFSKEENRSRNLINAPSPRQDAGSRVTSPRSAASPGNVVLHTASVESKPESKNSSPQIFASSTISTASQSKPSDSHTASLSRQASGNNPPEDGRKKSSQRSVGTLTLTADVGVMTEPDALGPCEPGTSVHLDGIVWHETDTGVLVVNVTWRNRTYVGTLLDATKHDWAPPRFSDSDLDIELRGKNGRPKRQRGNGTETTSSRKGRGRGNQSLADDAKGSPSAAAKRRGKNSESESFADDVSTIRTSAKRARVVPSRGGNTSTQQDRNTNGSNGSESSSCSSPVFIDCPHPKCNKRYRHINGLKYHQAHAHLDMEDNVKEELEIKEDNESKDSEVGSTTSSREEVEKISDSEAVVAKECASKRSSPAAASIENPTVSIEIPPAKESSTESGDQTKVTFMTIDAAVNEIERANSGAGVSETFKFSTDGIQQMIPVSGEQVSSAIISSVTEAVIKQAPALAQTSHSNSPYAMQSGRDMTINNVPMKRGTAIYPSVTPSTHVQEPSGVDSESALAVKALLQTQDSQDDLPGLTAPYSQDSPPPTLTLVSRTGPTEIQNHKETSQSFSAGYPQPTSSVYPVTSAHPRLVPSSSPTRESLHNHFSVAMTNTIQNRHLSTQVATSSPTIFNTNTLNPPQNSTKIVPEDSTSGTAQHSGVHPGLKEHFLSVVPPSYSTYPANKMAKGKTVPIPVDPNHGLMISPTHFARATSPGSQSGSAKKMKKKKKKSDGGENPKTSEGSYQIKQELSVSQESPNITPGFPSNGAAAVLNNLATSYQNDQQKIQNPVGRPEQVAPPGQMVIKSEPGIRFPPSQHFGAMSVQSSRKVPGVVMPSSCSSVGQFSNNITVTGTFHPHPDPHKPQTAVSAQAQDRQRTARVSPSPNSSSRNMTKLPLKSQNETDKSRVDHPEHLQTVVKPLSDHPAFEGSINQRTKFTGVKSPATNISQSKDARTEMNMGKFQDTLMSTIENAYAGSRQPTPRSKASTPQLEMPRSDQNPARSRPASPKEQRPLFEDVRPKPPVASPVVPRPRLPHEGVTPIPRPPGSPKLPVEVPLNPRGQYLQSIYNYPVANYGFVEGYPALMDPVRQQQQYIEYIQEFQKQHMLQQQHLLQQQQAQQQAQLHAERKNRKPLEPHPPKVAPKVEVAPIKSSPQNATNPPSEKGASWAAHHHIKRHSTGSISPFQNQIPKDKAHIPPLSHHPSPVALHPRYKSPQPSSHPQVSHTTPTHSRSHSVTVNPLPGVSGSPSISHPRADISDKGRRMDPPREDGRTPVRKPASPIPGSLNNERSPEKGKEGHPVTMYRTHGESPGHLPYFAAAPYPQVFDSRPAYRLPPFGVPGLQPGTPIFPTQQQWGPPHAALSKHSPVPVKPSIERPPSAPRSPREEHTQRGRTESKGRESFIHSSSKERRVREVPPIPRKLSRSPDPKPVSRTPLEKQSRSHTPTSNPDRAPSPPTQRHLHTHHHIHEGVPPYHPIIPQHYGYPGPIPAAPGLPASSDAMTTGYPAQFPQKRE